MTAADVTATDFAALIADQQLEWAIAHGWFSDEREQVDRLARMPYDEYLRSACWRRRRELMLALAGWSCQTCPANRVDGAVLHVHHRHYDNRGCEWPRDLVVLCDACHRKIHGIR